MLVEWTNALVIRSSINHPLSPQPYVFSKDVNSTAHPVLSKVLHSVGRVLQVLVNIISLLRFLQYPQKVCRLREPQLFQLQSVHCLEL